MKNFLLGLTICALPFSTTFAKPTGSSKSVKTEQTGYAKKSLLHNFSVSAQKNLIGEVTSIDAANGKIVIQGADKTSTTAAFNDKTSFRRVQPGQTSLTNAEQIKFSDIKVGDRVLIPGGVADAQTAVRQIIVMAREAIVAQQTDELEKRRARTTVGRITAVNPDKKELTVQTRGRNNAETITVSAAGNTKIQRYAPDSLKAADAVSATLTELRVGDQIRVLGDRTPDGTRVNAEEIISGSVARSVGTVSEINAARNEFVIKNAQTGQLTTVVIGKNTSFKRITPEVADDLRERFERRAARRSQTDSQNSGQNQNSQNERQRRRDERRNQNNGQPRTSQNRRQLFDDLPAITVSDLKKGDAVLITATNSGTANTPMTAVSIIAGGSDLLKILQSTQGGRNGRTNMSPGLPGNVSGGNDLRDDVPKN